MIYLSRLRLNQSRAALLWSANPYRMHQRLSMGSGHDPRLLFRLEEAQGSAQVLVQSQCQPDWAEVFVDLPVLAAPPEFKPLNLRLAAGMACCFRLLANPTVKRAGKRLGLMREPDQRAWLERKLGEAGCQVLSLTVTPRGILRSRKGTGDEQGQQSHLAVLYDGVLQVLDPGALVSAVEAGIGSAKGYGFGLLSLAPLRGA
ncbi:MAG: CRISPR-associated endoribonuclease Cse3 [Chloroflexi bacterium ADurb.Bin180]|nr:MAG: CRISPR-associated endoribonuclease Cse3 [Chloroflexi bacterium ADurb.Bin180]